MKEFDISHRSTMIQGVNGPNHINFHKKQSNSGGSHLTDFNNENNRFKATSSDNLELESDQDKQIIIQTEKQNKVNLNLQKLLTEKVEGDQTASNEMMDLMINKQSFSVNPKDLKKGSSNQTGGSEPATGSGNFLQILNQYT
jgi:hypothetical protein